MTIIAAIIAFTIGVIGSTLMFRQQIRTLSIDPSFGVLNAVAGKQAIKRVRGVKDVIFFDLDNLHGLNAALGYDRVDELVATAIGAHRRHDVLVSLQFSGDEFVAIVPAGDGASYAHRLLGTLQAQTNRLTGSEMTAVRSQGLAGLSATFAVIGGVRDYNDAIKRCQAGVQVAKACGRRACVEVL